MSGILAYARTHHSCRISLDGVDYLRWCSRYARLVTRLDFHAEQIDAYRLLRETFAYTPVIFLTPHPHEPLRMVADPDARSAVERALASLPPNWLVRRDSTSGDLLLTPLLALDKDHIIAPGALQGRLRFARSAPQESLSAGTAWLQRIPTQYFERLAQRADTSSLPYPSIESFREDVDIVYTWVDGFDPAWQQRRNHAWQSQQSGKAAESYKPERHRTSTDESRYVSTEELRYSMRSVFQYANWVRRIFVVTDGQVPYWLDTNHPKIQIVDHRELLPDSVFNSHAIESALHRIPGLAEHYLYLNDDVFFGRLAFPTDFFHANGIAKFFPSDLPIDPGPATALDLPIMAAAKNGRDLIEQRFGLAVTTKIRHTVHPQLRSVIEKMEKENPESFEHVGTSLFRSPQDLSVASSLHHWYAYALGRSVPAEPNYLYLNITDKHAGQTLDALASLQRYDTFCLNQEETAPNSDRARRELRRFFPKYFPLPAPWEIDS